jgi:hypothetical protein
MLPATQIAQKNFLRGLSRSSMLQERDIRTGVLQKYWWCQKEVFLSVSSCPVAAKLLD